MTALLLFGFWTPLNAGGDAPQVPQAVTGSKPSVPVSLRWVQDGSEGVVEVEVSAGVNHDGVDLTLVLPGVGRVSDRSLPGASAGPAGTVTWELGTLAAGDSDCYEVAVTFDTEGSYGFVYTLNVANNAPNPDNAYQLLDALLASPEIGASMTKASGFISTYKDASNYLTDLEKASTSFPEEQLANLQFFRAEANEMKYGLVDPAVEAVKAA